MSKSTRAARIARRRQPRLLGAIALSVASLVLAGCTGGTGANGASKAGGGSSETVVDSMSPVTQIDAPTEPFSPPKDKRILILMCSSAGAGCVNEGNEEKAIAESLGWKVDLVDGKFDPTVWNQAVKQAAESGVDGIISISADPNLMAEAMGIVQDKKIPFVLTNQAPDDADIAGVDAYVGPDPVQGGKDIADWIIADSKGKANVLLIDAPGFTNILKRSASIASSLKSDCKGCEVTSIDMSAATVGTTLAPLVTSRIQQDPKLDYVIAPDDCCVGFANQGIQQAGKTASTKVISIGGFTEQLSELRKGSGPVAADLATPNRYMGWLAVDSLARRMAGLPAEKFWAAPQRLFTTANADEVSADKTKLGWNLDFDYRAQFEDMWGIK
jgi:ABC-type sugar transport system substrate-binding protein